MPQPPQPLPADMFWERAVAEKFGVSRTALRALRNKHLDPDRDWRFHNNAVVLTGPGLEKIQAVLAAPAAPLPPPPTPAPSAAIPAPSAAAPASGPTCDVRPAGATGGPAVGALTASPFSSVTTVTGSTITFTDHGAAPLVGSPLAESLVATEATPAPDPIALRPGPPPRRHFVVIRVPQHRLDSPQKKILIARPVPADFAPCKAWDLPKRMAGLVDSPELRERPIRVRDNSHFVPGMVLEAAAIGHGMWQYLGRLPRRLGKW